MTVSKPNPQADKINLDDLAPVKSGDDSITRLRVLEERYSALRKKVQFTEENMLKDIKELYQEVTVLNESMLELKKDVSSLADKILKLNEEMRSSVSKTDFNVIAKYLEFWQPFNFITREEAEKLVKKEK